MQVVVGPVSARSARSWCRYARAVLARGVSHGGLPGATSDEIRTVFERYLTEWERQAAEPVFRWEVDLPDEVAEYHIHAFHRIAVALDEAAHRRGGRAAPPESEEFYGALVASLVAALRDAGPSSAEFAEHLASFWPTGRAPGVLGDGDGPGG